MPSAILVIAGGSGEEIARLSRVAEKTGVKESILFLGKVPPEEIPHLLTVADVLVSPRAGGMNPPAKIYTYMQSGRPVVATDIPAHSSVTGRSAARLTSVEPQGIAEGILWALLHPAEALRMAEAAQEKVRGLTSESQSTPIIEAYKRLSERIGTG
jgi:glycosyltransferase involved in cell wall biosynthesis